jgi:hypothetical protein
MQNNESGNEGQSVEAGADAKAADRRSFMRAAVKTAVAGTVAVGIAGAASKADAAPLVGACGAAVEVPKAVVKARVLLNNQVKLGRQDIIDILGGIFNGSACTVCGLGGFPGTRDPGTVIEIGFELAYLPKDQLSAVVFTEVNGG